MKRLLFPVLILILALALTACGAPAAESAPTPTATVEPAPTATPTPAPPRTPTPAPTPTPTLLAETEDMGQEYMDSIVYYGDSNINGLRLLELLPGGYATNQIWTPMSGTLTLSRWNVDKIVYPETWTEIDVTEAMKTKQPEYLIINLGMNGVSFMDEEYFTETYDAMVAALAEANPDTKIILSSIFPVAKSYPHQESINNDVIDAANGWIYGIAEARSLRYLDVASALKGEDGALPEELHDGNGFHLTAEGLGIVLDYIRTHGYQ